jgi:hypothetical protein
MRDRLRIRDVRLYIRDLLMEYASLQKFKPKPMPLARCMDWQRLLMEFEWPHYKEVSCLSICLSICKGPCASVDWQRLLMEFEWPHYKEVRLSVYLYWATDG